MPGIFSFVGSAVLLVTSLALLRCFDNLPPNNPSTQNCPPDIFCHLGVALSISWSSIQISQNAQCRQMSNLVSSHICDDRYYLVFTQLQQVPLPAAAISDDASPNNNKVSGSTTPSKPPKAAPLQFRPANIPSSSLGGSVEASKTPPKPLSSSQSPPHLSYFSPSPFPSLDDASMLEHWSTRAPPSISTSLPSPSSPPSSSTRSSPSPSPAHLSNPGGPLLVSLAELAMLPPHSSPNKVGILIIAMSVFFLGVTRK